MPTIGDLASLPSQRVLDSYDLEASVKSFLGAWNQQMASAMENFYDWDEDVQKFWGRVRVEILLEGRDAQDGDGYQIERLVFDDHPLALVRQRTNRGERERETVEDLRARVALLDREKAYEFEAAMLRLVHGYDGSMHEAAVADDATGFLGLGATESANLETGVVSFQKYERLCLVTCSTVRSNHDVFMLGRIEDGRLFILRRLGDEKQVEVPAGSPEEAAEVCTAQIADFIESVGENAWGRAILHMSPNEGHSVGLVKGKEGVVASHFIGAELQGQARSDDAPDYFMRTARSMIMETLERVRPASISDETGAQAMRV